MKLRLENIDDKELLQQILSVKQFDLKSKIKFFPPLSFERSFSIWKMRADNNSEIYMSDSLLDASQFAMNKDCVLASIHNKDVVTILFLDADKTTIYGYVSIPVD